MSQGDKAKLKSYCENNKTTISKLVSKLINECIDNKYNCDTVHG